MSYLCGSFNDNTMTPYSQHLSFVDAKLAVRFMYACTLEGGGTGRMEDGGQTVITDAWWAGYDPETEELTIGSWMLRSKAALRRVIPRHFRFLLLHSQTPAERTAEQVRRDYEQFFGGGFSN